MMIIKVVAPMNADSTVPHIKCSSQDLNTMGSFSSGVAVTYCRVYQYKNEITTRLFLVFNAKSIEINSSLIPLTYIYVVKISRKSVNPPHYLHS